MKRSVWVGAAAIALLATACSPAVKDTADKSAPAPAAAGAPTSEADMQAAVARHVTAVKAGDVDGVMADYADDAIMVSPPGQVTPTGVLVGKTNVRQFFTWLASPANLPGAQSMATTTEVAGPNTLLFRYTAFPGTPKEAKGYDVFVFRDGKIAFQTTAASPKP